MSDMQLLHMTGRASQGEDMMACVNCKGGSEGRHNAPPPPRYAGPFFLQYARHPHTSSNCVQFAEVGSTEGDSYSGLCQSRLGWLHVMWRSGLQTLQHRAQMGTDKGQEPEMGNSQKPPVPIYWKGWGGWVGGCVWVCPPPPPPPPCVHVKRSEEWDARGLR